MVLLQDIPALRQGPAESGIAAAIRKQRRPKTIAEQIADEVGGEIIEGRIGAGQRVGEQELAERYSISRGPVRDAIRILERRGLVEFFPRRGAFAIQLSFDLIADIFNLQASFLGLATRYFCRVAPDAAFELVSAEIDELKRQQENPRCSPVEFALQSGRVGGRIKKNSSNDYLLRIGRSVAAESLWGFMWHQRPLDYLTTERRRQGIEQWGALLEAARRRDDRTAESIAQQVLFDSRDNVLAVLREVRAGAQDERRLLTNGQLSPQSVSTGNGRAAKSR